MEYSNSNAVSGYPWGERWPSEVVGQDYNVSDVGNLFFSTQPVELSLTAEDFTLHIRTYSYLIPVVACVYLALIPLGQRFMRDRQAFRLGGLLAGWNLALAIFSFAGSLRLIPFVVYLIRNFGVSYLLCRHTVVLVRAGPTAFWMTLFIWSKIPELLDTAFLVLRKKPVNFLHWFHHVTVLGYCWYATCHEHSGILYGTMNYAVHSVMYLYYFLAAMGKRPSWGKLVTILQISQMIAGTGLAMYHWYLSKTVPFCNCHASSQLLAFIMYGVYLYLFVAFFVKRYSSPREKSQ